MKIKWQFGKRGLAALLGLALGLGSVAAEAGAKEAKAALLKKFAKLPETTPVRQSEIPGIYEVNIYGQAAYTDERATFLLTGGALINAVTLENLTKKGGTRALRDGFLGIPSAEAIKTVYGKGERKIVAFENPDCPNCRKQAEIWTKNPQAFNATVYTFLIPLQSKPDSLRKSARIICSQDPSKAWNDWMGGRGGLPLEKSADGSVTLAAGADVSCPASEKSISLGRQIFDGFGFTGTPSVVFENGWTSKGWMTIDEYEKAFAKVKADLEALPAP